jgi:predicted nucleic acid-binding protein
MNASALVDTGAIVALLDSKDDWHAVCRDAFQEIRLPMLTSLAALTELFHLVGSNRREMEAAWRYIGSGAIIVATITHQELRHLHSLMAQYSDRPMDFADATLVYLAARESLSTILTVDQDNFSTYHIGGRKRFRVLPTERP